MTNYEWLKCKIEYLGQNPTSECVEWPFAKKNYGHGYLIIKRTAVLAHRLAYVLATGKEPPVNVNHICSNPPCINPDHLYSGTQVQNKRDEVLVEQFGVNGKIPSEHIEYCREIIANHQKEGHGFEEPTDEIAKRVKILDLISDM